MTHAYFSSESGPFWVQLITAACRRQIKPLSPSASLPSASLIHPSNGPLFIAIQHFRTWRERPRIETRILRPLGRKKQRKTQKRQNSNQKKCRRKKCKATRTHAPARTQSAFLTWAVGEKVFRVKVLERCVIDQLVFNTVCTHGMSKPWAWLSPLCNAEDPPIFRKSLTDITASQLRSSLWAQWSWAVCFSKRKANVE